MWGRPRWALGVGAALTAMAAVNGACADVRPIDMDECSASCVLPTTDDATADDDDPDSAITLSLFGGGRADAANNVPSDLTFDPKTLPPILVSGLPSPISAVAARTPDTGGVSPYDFFADVIDVPHSARAPFFLFAPSFTSHLSDFLWASYDFFGPPSGDIAARRGLPLSIDADALFGALTMRTRVAPTPSPSPQSGPPPSDASKPFGQVGDEAGLSAEVSSDGAESPK